MKSCPLTYKVCLSQTPTRTKSRKSGERTQLHHTGTLPLPLVECLRPIQDPAYETFCGALLRAPGPNGHEVRSTYGGVIHVDGQPFVLTTAHALVFAQQSWKSGSQTRPSKGPRSTHASESRLSSNGAVVAGLEGPASWRPLGKAHAFALSHVGRISADNDWLLISIPSEHVLPNWLGPEDPAWVAYRRDAEHTRSICTSRGVLRARVMPGKSYLMFGKSSFKVTKLELQVAIGKPKT